MMGGIMWYPVQWSIQYMISIYKVRPPSYFCWFMNPESQQGQAADTTCVGHVLQH